VASPFTEWENFYVIVGSSGAALTGLQFLVVAFVAESRERMNVKNDGGVLSTFATPAIVHFCVVLFLASVLSAPWHNLTTPAYVLGASGAMGIGHTALILIRARRQTSYKLVLEDWMFYVVLPFVAYAVLFAASFEVIGHTAAALFPVAATSLMLLLIGIHSAWDTVTYIAVQRMTGTTKPPPNKRRSRS
jgi:hypothetical protein